MRCVVFLIWVLHAYAANLTASRPLTTGGGLLSTAIKPPETTSVRAPVLMGYTPIYVGNVPFPVGYLPLFKAESTENVTGFAQFVLPGGVNMFSPVYGAQTFAVVSSSSAVLPMYDSNNAVVGSSLLPVYSSALPSNVLPASLGVTPIGFLPVYSASSGVSKKTDLLGNQGSVPVFTSVVPPLSRTRRVTTPPLPAAGTISKQITLTTSLPSSAAIKPPVTTSVRAPVLMGYTPIYTGTVSFPVGYLPLFKAESTDNVTGFAQFVLPDGKNMFAPVYGTQTFAVMGTSGDVPFMYDSNNVVVGSSLLPVYSFALPPNVVPTTLLGVNPIGYLPVYSASSGVSKKTDLLGNQGSVPVFTSVVPPLSRTRGVLSPPLPVAGTISKQITLSTSLPPLPKSTSPALPSIPPSSSTPRPLFQTSTSNPVSTTRPVNTPSTTPPPPGNAFIAVTSDGYLKLVSGIPTGSPWTFVSSFPNSGLLGIPIYKQ